MNQTQSAVKPLFVDIETLANAAMEPHLPEPQAPSNYRDPKKIAAYVERARAKAQAEMALDIDFSRIVALGFAVGDDEPAVLLARDDEAERAALARFWELVPLHCPIIGYNLRGFDLPIILRRSWVLGVRPPRPLDLGRYSREVVDLMQAIYHEGYGPGPRARGLKAVAGMYAVPNPLPEVDGSQVAGMSDQELAAYCGNDVRITQELARRTRGWYW